MNGVNTEINNGSASASPQHTQQLHNNSYESSPNNSAVRGKLPDQKRNLSNLSNSENERLEDMLKICTEYADRQNQSCNSSITSSPIVQNRIKTNGSLPRDKKSPFYHDLSGSQLQQSFSGGSNGNLTAKPHNGAISTSSGYENVRLVGQNRVEISGPTTSSPKTGYENVVLGKYVPQSPRTKIRTTCMSPKKEHTFSSAFGQAAVQAPAPPLPNPKPTKQNEYEQLIKTFEEKLKLEMQAIEESSRYQPANARSSTTTIMSTASAEHTPAKRTTKNINNLTLNLQQSQSLQNSPKLSKKPAPAPRNLTHSIGMTSSLPRITAAACNTVVQRTAGVKIVENGDVDVDQLKKSRRELLKRIQVLKCDISELQKQEDEVLRELDMEKALVSAELNSVGNSVEEFENQFQALQNKIHRLEAQRNATRVMEENQQAKLKQSIEMKQDQVKKLKAMLKQKPNNDCLKEELHNVCESLENDRKTFEDLEFQYLEEESEWHAYREELHAEEKGLTLKIEEKRLELQHLEKQELTNQNYASTDTKTLKNHLISLLNELKLCQEQLRSIESSISDITGQLSSSEDDENLVDDKSASPPMQGNLGAGVMSQSLFGSAELLCPKRTNVDIMSKSVNENMFYNNKIELPSGVCATSTPKRPSLKVVSIGDAELLDTNSDKSPKSAAQAQTDPLLRLKYNVNAAAGENVAQSERVKFNLSLGSDDFEVNPLERRVPSQDDIDRICKVTLDAPISTKGASTKIFDSIKEIERNRQLLLAQQGHHVIEHERQKMQDLKKKCHDEARAQYISMLSCSIDGSNSSPSPTSSPHSPNSPQSQELQKLSSAESERLTSTAASQRQNSGPSEAVPSKETTADNSSQQRHSQPDFESPHHHHHPQSHSHSHTVASARPLSEANSELSCDLLSESNTCKSSIELSGAGQTTIGSNRYSAEPNMSGDDAAKRSSVNSNETTSAGSGSGHSERKRALPKHQRPLTRYLPIFSPDLNLRLHIESAGHQIALCPHVFVDAYSCRGYLHKLGATFHGWARRWFVLDRQRNALIYYADKSERKPRGGAYFSTIDEVYLDHLNASKSGRPHCTFIVKTKKRSYHLQAASDAAARIWIDAIITGAQGNLDY